MATGQWCWDHELKNNLKNISKYQLKMNILYDYDNSSNFIQNQLTLFLNKLLHINNHWMHYKIKIIKNAIFLQSNNPLIFYWKINDVYDAEKIVIKVNSEKKWEITTNNLTSFNIQAGVYIYEINKYINLNYQYYLSTEIQNYKIHELPKGQIGYIHDNIIDYSIPKTKSIMPYVIRTSMRESYQIKSGQTVYNLYDTNFNDDWEYVDNQNLTQIKNLFAASNNDKIHYSILPFFLINSKHPKTWTYTDASKINNYFYSTPGNKNSLGSHISYSGNYKYQATDIASVPIIFNNLTQYSAPGYFYLEIKNDGIVVNDVNNKRIIEYPFKPNEHIINFIRTGTVSSSDLFRAARVQSQFNTINVNRTAPTENYTYYGTDNKNHDVTILSTSSPTTKALVESLIPNLVMSSTTGFWGTWYNHMLLNFPDMSNYNNLFIYEQEKNKDTRVEDQAISLYHQPDIFYNRQNNWFTGPKWPQLTYKYSLNYTIINKDVDKIRHDLTKLTTAMSSKPVRGSQYERYITSYKIDKLQKHFFNAQFKEYPELHSVSFSIRNEYPSFSINDTSNSGSFAYNLIVDADILDTPNKEDTPIAISKYRNSIIQKTGGKAENYWVVYDMFLTDQVTKIWSGFSTLDCDLIEPIKELRAGMIPSDTATDPSYYLDYNSSRTGFINFKNTTNAISDLPSDGQKILNDYISTTYWKRAHMLYAHDTRRREQFWHTIGFINDRPYNQGIALIAVPDGLPDYFYWNMYDNSPGYNTWLHDDGSCFIENNTTQPWSVEFIFQDGTIMNRNVNAGNGLYQQKVIQVSIEDRDKIKWTYRAPIDISISRFISPYGGANINYIEWNTKGYTNVSGIANGVNINTSTSDVPYDGTNTLYITISYDQKKYTRSLTVPMPSDLHITWDPFDPDWIRN